MYRSYFYSVSAKMVVVADFKPIRSRPKFVALAEVHGNVVI